MSDELPHDEGLQELYRGLPADEPRAALDETIMAAARHSVATRMTSTVARRLRWALPLAAAAGVVLTLTLTRLTPEQRDLGLVARNVAPSADRQGHLRAPGSDGGEGFADAVRGAVDEAATQTPPRGDARSAARPAARHESAAQVSSLEEKRPEVGGTAPAAPSPPTAMAKASPAAPTPPQAASAPAPPAAPPSALADRMATNTTAREADGKPRALAAPSSPDSAARAAQLAAAVAAAAPRTESYARADLEKPGEWPFGLEAGLAAQEACRRVSAALHRDCVFRNDIATVTLAPPAAIDRGPLAGNDVSRLTLTLHDGRLRSVALVLVGGTEETLVAPEQAK